MNVVDVEQKQLLTKIEAFSFDQPGAIFSFTQRLARENGWSIKYASRVIEEYRKFTFLAIVTSNSHYGNLTTVRREI